MDALGYQQITSLTASTALTVPAGTQMALVQAESQAVRWRDDGTDPTATVGMILGAGETLEYDSSQLSVVEFIEVTVGAKLNINYYGVQPL
jgi:hypothetical protein